MKFLKILLLISCCCGQLFAINKYDSNTTSQDESYRRLRTVLYGPVVREVPASRVAQPRPIPIFMPRALDTEKTRQNVLLANLSNAIEVQNQERVAQIVARIKNRAYINLRDSFGRTFLFKAVQVGNKNIVQLLLNAGADAYIADNIGTTLLDISLDPDSDRAKYADITKMLIRALGPTGINKKNKDGYTPLMLAVLDNNQDAVQELLNMHADPNIQDSIDGNTALMIAASENRDTHIMELLLRAGASTSIINNNGETVFRLAEQANYASAEKIAVLQKK